MIRLKEFKQAIHVYAKRKGLRARNVRKCPALRMLALQAWWTR